MTQTCVSQRIRRRFKCRALLALVFCVGSVTRVHNLFERRDEIPYVHTFLEHTSLWGMGSNARTIPPRRNNVPLVRWNMRAVDIMRQRWNQLQSDANACSRSMYIYAHQWGITSQMRDVSDAAMVALTFGRALKIITNVPTPTWCKENAWLECFFEPIGAEHCSHSVEQVHELPPYLPNALNGVAMPHARMILSGNSLLHMHKSSQFTFVLDDPTFFPMKLWMGLVNEGLVHFVDAQNQRIDASAISADVFHSLAVSSLRTILTPLIFRPRPHIIRKVESKRRRLGIAIDSCVALHVRLTDKPSDGGVAARAAQDLAYVIPALARMRGRTGAMPKCLLLLSDDDSRSLHLLRTKIGQSFEIKTVTQMRSFFTTLWDYKTYAKIGHQYFSGDPDVGFLYYEATVVDALVASYAGTLIGMGSSGFSQLVSQYIGFRHQADANAFAIWQEDVG
jgi:hypothetical protein